MRPPRTRTARALAAALLITSLAIAGEASAEDNAAPAEAPVLVQAQQFVRDTLTLRGRAQCFDDGKPKGVCTTSLRAVAAGGACDAPALGGGEVPANVASGGEWAITDLAPGTLYALYARSSDGEKVTCSQPVRVQTPRDDSRLEAPVLDAFSGRPESPALVRGVTVEGLLSVYRNGKLVAERVAPLAWGEFIASVPLVKGRNRIEVRAVNPYSGEQSPPSNTIELRY